jgi:hypothetical protein
MEVKRFLARNDAIISKIQKEIIIIKRRNSVLGQCKSSLYLDDVMKSFKRRIFLQTYQHISNRTKRTSSNQVKDITLLLENSINTIKSCNFGKHNGNDSNDSACSSICCTSNNSCCLSAISHHLHVGIPECITSVAESTSSIELD